MKVAKVSKKTSKTTPNRIKKFGLIKVKTAKPAVSLVSAHIFKSRPVVTRPKKTISISKSLPKKLIIKKIVKNKAVPGRITSPRTAPRQTPSSSPLERGRKLMEGRGIDAQRRGRVREDKRRGMIRDEEFQKLSITDKFEKPVNVTIVDSPLDSYLSPHILDLSQARFIEKVRPTADVVAMAHSELPGGDILTKLYVFELVSFKDSEIWRALKKIGQIFQLPFKNIGQNVDLAPKFKQVEVGNLLDKKPSIWSETVVGNLITLAIHIVIGIVYAVGDLFSSSPRKNTKDEEVSFTLRSAQDGVVDEYDSLEELAEIYSPSILTQLQQAEDILTEDNLELVDQEKDVLSNKDLAWSWFKDEESFAPRGRRRLPDFSYLRFKLYPREFSVKAIVAFATIAVLIILPFKIYNYAQSAGQVQGQVLGETEQAVENLQLAQEKLMSFNFEQAGEYFTVAGGHFMAAQGQLDAIGSFIATIAEKSPISNAYQSGIKLLDAGSHLSVAGESLIKSIAAITDKSDSTLTTKIKEFNIINKLTLAEFRAAQNDIKDVNISHIPADNQQQFKELVDKLPVFEASLVKADSLSQFAVNFLGDNDLKRYLVIFQNDNELRATGGFMGSFALVDLESGAIKNITVPAGGTYDVRAGFKELIQAPKPLQLLTSRFEFQDANWWPDFPTSARSIAWFYEKSGGPTIDGVVAINSDWMKALLAATGPIDMPEYKKTITAENFEDEIQQEVEINKANPQQPKKILADLAPKLVARIFAVKPENILGLASALGSGLKEKDIQIYLTNATQEKTILDNGWDGQQVDTGLDYLNVVATNIGGGKTDSVMVQKIYHQAEITADSSIIDTVLIQRTHNGPVDETFTNQTNRSYVRVYAPKGSVLLKASGFGAPPDTEFVAPADYLQEDPRLQNENAATIDAESGTRTYEENNKTVFANWLMVKPGQSREAVLVYKLPFKFNVNNSFSGHILKNIIKGDYNYGLLVQKQSGIGDDEVVSEITYPTELNPQLTYPQTAESESGQTIFRQTIKTDFYNLLNLK